MTILHLIYQQKAYEGHAKDYEFSGTSMREHWQSGHEDTSRTLKQRQWLDLPPQRGGIVVHDVHRLGGRAAQGRGLSAGEVPSGLGSDRVDIATFAMQTSAARIGTMPTRSGTLEALFERLLPAPNEPTSLDGKPVADMPCRRYERLLVFRP